MKSIEIKTTQNVVLEYELADLRDRMVAFLIDMICLVIAITVLSWIGYGLGVYENDTYSLAYIILLYCVFLFYSLVFETLNNGQSIGKMAMKIQVIKMAGGHAQFSDYAARWTFRIIDIYFSLGGIASILIASSSKAQRIGDIVAHTSVIKLVPKMNLKFKDLLTIQSQDSYTPVYSQAKQLAEEDALLIKTTLERHRKYQNDAHQEALQLLTEKMMLVLNVENEIHDKRKFLQTILNDYVVLTR